MRNRLYCWLVVLASAALVVYFSTTGHVRRIWSAVFVPNPLIDYPATLDLGDHEIGDQVAHRFAIANHGGRELVVEDIRTNCSCTGMEQEENGQYVRVESLRIKAGEHADLVMRVSVRGVPVGAAMLNVVEFQTNDPAQPTGRIEAVVRRVFGGVSASPPSFVFGRVLVGAKVRHVIDVRDRAESRRAVERVTSTNLDRVTARLLPAESKSRGPDAEPSSESILIGQVEVTINTETPGAVNEAVQIHLTEGARRPDNVAVVGSVTAPIEISPASLVLPRASAGGPLFDARCICRSMNGKPLTLTVDSVPPGLTAEILAEGGESARTIRIIWDPRVGKPPVDGQRQRVRFRAKAGEDEALLELQVLLRM